MKKTFITLVMLLAAITLSAQEKKIDFKNGVVNICSSSKIHISGYDGDQVVIKSNQPDNNIFYSNTNNNFAIRGYQPGEQRVDSVSYVYFSRLGKDRSEKSEGLTPLGSAKEDPTHIDQAFEFQQAGGQLYIKDKSYDGQNVFFYHNATYEILIPNSVKLMVSSSDCSNGNNQQFIFSSDALKIDDFSGDLQVSSKYKAVELTDVSGPALINTLGGDIKVVFENEKPNALFSIISNDGDIDISMPNNSKVTMKVTGQEILSNLDFRIDQETNTANNKVLDIALNGGGKKFDVKTEYGTVYLRKN